MPASELLVNRIRETLLNKGIADIEEKAMFNGICFMLNGKMCVCASNDELLCRIGPAYLEALEMNGVRGMIRNGKPLKDFVFVSDEAMKSNADFNHWIEMALDFNQYAKASKKKQREI